MPDPVQTTLEEALRDPKVGPRPISIEEYRRRHIHPSTPAQKPAPVPQKKQRSGSEAHFQRKLQEAQYELFLAGTREARRLVGHKINRIKMERKNYRQKKKAAKRTLK